MAEHLHTRSECSLFDICHMGEILVEGPQAFDLIQKTVSRDISKMVVGQMVLATFTNEQGGILDDLTVYKYSDQKFMLVVNASNIQRDYEWVAKAQKDFHFNAVVRNESDSLAKLDIQGPHAQKILQQIASTDLNTIQFYHFAEPALMDSPSTVSRSGYTGEDGFELYFPVPDAVRVWNKLIELGSKPAGLGARDTLRLEAAMNLYGHEMNETVSPLECRYAWVTSLEKDFIGVEPLREQKKNGIPRKLVGIEMIDRQIARNPYPIFSLHNEPIGVVTSGSFSPTLKKNIALALVQFGSLEKGAECLVEVRGQKCRAKVINLPSYRRSDGT
ncbi:MAG: glycine cleavage system aminomethyltransferase GcvT [Candidatus Diapherotrites archaeon]|nr:glycine cleavage system aminomethyltransferase GcvT [Candidatus Diapherotrites archaeon]